MNRNLITPSNRFVIAGSFALSSFIVFVVSSIYLKYISFLTASLIGSVILGFSVYYYIQFFEERNSKKNLLLVLDIARFSERVKFDDVYLDTDGGIRAITLRDLIPLHYSLKNPNNLYSVEFKNFTKDINTYLVKFTDPNKSDLFIVHTKSLQPGQGGVVVWKRS